MRQCVRADCVGHIKKHLMFVKHEGLLILSGILARSDILQANLKSSQGVCVRACVRVCVRVRACVCAR